MGLTLFHVYKDVMFVCESVCMCACVFVFLKCDVREVFLENLIDTHLCLRLYKPFCHSHKQTETFFIFFFFLLWGYPSHCGTSESTQRHQDCNQSNSCHVISPHFYGLKYAKMNENITLHLRQLRHLWIDLCYIKKSIYCHCHHWTKHKCHRYN